MRLTADVQAILEKSTVTGNRLDLPPGQLDRKLYLKVAAALEMIGAKWNKKERAHLFDEDAEQVVADAIATGAVTDLRKEFQFFETPETLARRLAEWADLRPEQSVLEPSAGRGRIVTALRAFGVEPHACELFEPNRARLQAMGVTIVASDFLALSGLVYDRIVANPPFSRQQDILHVSHMWELLAPDGRLVSIMSPAWTYRTDRRSTAFRDLVEKAGGEWEMLPDNTFAASGTSVNAGVLVLDKGRADA